MQLQLQQKHIEAAIRDFISKAGITFSVDEINFTAGRGKDGLTAAVDLEDPFTSLLDQASEAPEGPQTVQGNPANQVPNEVAKPEPVKEAAKPAPAKKPEPAAEAPPFSAEEAADKVEAPKQEEAKPEAEPEKPKRKAGALFG